MKKFTLFCFALLGAVTAFAQPRESQAGTAATTWTIAANYNLLGSDWDPTATANDMTLSSGVYTLVKQGCRLEGNVGYPYRVAKNHDWAENYGAPNGDDLYLYVDSTGEYTVTFRFVFNSPSNYSLTATSVRTGSYVPEERTWTMTGVPELMGADWDPNATANDMTREANGTYVLHKNNVCLLANVLYEYKVVGDHSWRTNFSIDNRLDAPNASLSVSSNGVYNITFTWDVENKALSATTTYVGNLVNPALIGVQGYYYVGSLNGWSTTDTTYAFRLQEDGLTWTLTVSSYENDGWFKIAPDIAYADQENFWSKSLCAPYDGCELLSGSMAYGLNGAWHMPQNDSIYSYLIRIVPTAMTFEIIPQTVLLESDAVRVFDAEGADVTRRVDIVWYNSDKQQIGEGRILGGYSEGTPVYYSVLLDSVLGKQYREIRYKEAVLDRTVKIDTLTRIETATLSGRVVSFGTGLPRCKVELTQWLNRKYEVNTYTLTDANGAFTMGAYNDSTKMVISASGYFDDKRVLSDLTGVSELGEIEMREVQGKVIVLNMTYREATRQGTDPVVQNWYADTRNIEYSVENLTTRQALTDFGVQQGNIILPLGVEPGHNLKVTVRSLNNKFAETSATGTMGSNDTLQLALDLIAPGGLEVNYEEKADDNILAMLYDQSGKLVMRTVCSTMRLTFTDLKAGNYTLISMGYNGSVGSVASLSDLSDLDVREGEDYVRRTVSISNGVITSVTIASVPELDASKFEYTGRNTSYLPNKMQLVVGNFITLSARIDFKEQYINRVRNMKLIVDIPDGCDFVPNSVVIGTKALPHSLNGNKLTIVVKNEDIDQRIRFCVIPMETGSFVSSACVEFDYNGSKTQPIGQIKFESTAGELYVPSFTKTSTVNIGGIGVPKAEVEIYDNDALIGLTRSRADGKWTFACELNNAYNLSAHEIHVKYRGEGNLVGLTETKTCYYDINAVVPKTVTMINTAHPAGNLTPKVYENVFDFEGILNVSNSYLYWPDYPDFTFVIDMSDNDTTKVSDVVLYVYTTDGSKRRLKATFNENLGRFVATGSFDMYSLPVNVSVDYTNRSNPIMDAEMFEEAVGYGKNLGAYIEQQDSLLTALLNQYNQAINSLDIEMMRTIEQQICAKLNISWQEPVVTGTSMSETEIDAFIASCEALLNDSSLNQINILAEYESYVADSLSSLIEGVSVTTCDNIVESNLVALGYTVVNKTDGTQMYYLTTDSQIVYVDFAQNICVTYRTNNLAAYINIRGDFDFVKWIRDQSKIIQDGANRLKTLVEAIGNIADSALETLAKSNKSLTAKATELAGKTMDCTMNGDLAGATKFRDEYNKVMQSIERNKKVTDWMETEFKAGRVGKKFGKCLGLYNIIDNAINMGNQLNEIISLYFSIPCPCEAQPAEAENLTTQVIQLGMMAASYYTLRIASDVATVTGVETGLFAAIPTGGASLTAVGVSVGLVLANIGLDILYNRGYDAKKTELSNQISALECWNGDDGDGNLQTEPTTPILDPSGYVYEAVPTNRIEGVKATVYYRDETTAVEWDAAEYGQINPQITDESGLYAWDVPQGMWQVVFEKDGYATTQTDWLPVPPPQLEINIPMSQAVNPYVESAMGTESGITIYFSKYMKPASLSASNRITVTRNGKSTGGHLEMIDVEENPVENAEYASIVKFVPNSPFKSSDAVILTVKKEVQSYAGMPMTENFVQQIAIESEITEIECDSVITVQYLGQATLDIAVLPGTAAKGKTVLTESTSSMIATIDAAGVVLDNNGRAKLTINGNLPGNASIRLTMPERGLEKYVKVIVVNHEIGVVKTPKASKLSGSTIDTDYLLTLTCATNGATIYYTIDGTNPGNKPTRIKYVGPFRLPAGKVLLQAMAVREGMADSEVVSYVYIVTGDEEEAIETVDRDYNYEALYQDGKILISGAQGASCTIYDLQGRELANCPNLEAATAIDVPKCDVYIVNLVFGKHQTVVTKIMGNNL